MSIRIFQKLSVNPLLLGGTTVGWQLHPLFFPRVARPFTFTLEWSRSGVNDAKDWRPVATIAGQANVASSYAVTDPQRHLWSSVDRLHYRVLLKDNDGQLFRSDPQTIFGQLSRREYLLARYILQREHVRLKQPGVGACGLLYRRRDWGTPCDREACLDPDTGAPTNPNCPRCFGTGWVNGYYTPVTFLIDPNLEDNPKLEADDQMGYTGTSVRMVRALACPLPRTRDVLLEMDSDVRWYVHTVGTLSEMAGYPLIVKLELKQADPTDVSYLLSREHVS